MKSDIGYKTKLVKYTILNGLVIMDFVDFWGKSFKKIYYPSHT